MLEAAFGVFRGLRSGPLALDVLASDLEATNLRTTTIPEAAIDIGLSHSRATSFADAGPDLRHFKLTAEAGYQLGPDAHLVTTFTDFDPAGGRFFAAAGIALGP